MISCATPCPTVQDCSTPPGTFKCCGLMGLNVRDGTGKSIGKVQEQMCWKCTPTFLATDSGQAGRPTPQTPSILQPAHQHLPPIARPSGASAAPAEAPANQQRAMLLPAAVTMPCDTAYTPARRSLVLLLRVDVAVLPQVATWRSPSPTATAGRAHAAVARVAPWARGDRERRSPRPVHGACPIVVREVLVTCDAMLLVEQAAKFSMSSTRTGTRCEA